MTQSFKGYWVFPFPLYSKWMCINPSDAEVRIFRENSVNTITADALAPSIAMSSTGMALTIDRINIHRLVQERRNSSALAMELHLSCTNPSICPCLPWGLISTTCEIAVLRKYRKWEYIFISLNKYRTEVSDTKIFYPWSACIPVIPHKSHFQSTCIPNQPTFLIPWYSNTCNNFQSKCIFHQ